MRIALPRYQARRVLRAIRRGSSSPVVVETDAGRFLTKLRGAAQGVLPLIAEVIVAELATALGLPVPERAVVALEERVPSDDRNDELADLLARSHGDNLGFRYLDAAVDLAGAEAARIDAAFARRVLWLDGLVMNADRTPRNPNILRWNGQPWLIDHGAALPFHYALGRIKERDPREPAFDAAQHLFGPLRGAMEEVDASCTAILSRDVLNAASAAPPDSFVTSAFPADEPARVHAIYAAFLWKRLKPPRPFL